MDEFDLILVMEEWQRLKAQALNPQAAHKVQLFADKKIPDPYGHDEEAFRQVFKQMDAAARRWAEELDPGGRCWPGSGPGATACCSGSASGCWPGCCC